MAYEFREVDVRKFTEGIGFTEILAWAAFFRCKSQSDRPWIRDADQIGEMAAALYG